MSTRRAIGVSALLTISPALAEDPIARLPWDRVLTAGPNCTSADDPTLDLWVIEDFSIEQPASLRSWQAQGFASGSPVIEDVTVRVYDRFPTDDGAVIIMQSVPGSGSYTDGGLNRSFFNAEFDGMTLSAGAYHVVWTVHRVGPFAAIVWSTESEHDVGGGEQQNAFLWNPGGGREFPDNIMPIPDDLKGNGQTGVNFTLLGEPPSCPADLDGDGDADADDFFAYLDAFADGDMSVCDIDADGDCDAKDFFGYLDLFAQQC